MNRRFFAILVSAVFFATMFTSAIVPFVSALDDIDEAIRGKDEEKEDRQGELDKSKKRQLLYEQEGLTIAQRLVALETDMANTQQEVSEKEQALADLNSQLGTKTVELETAKMKVDGTTLSLYKESRRSIVEILFSSEGMEELLRQMGFRKFGMGFLLSEMKDYQTDYLSLANDFNAASREAEKMKTLITELQGMTVELASERIMYEQMVAEEASKQAQLIGEIANITAEQEALLLEKMAATEESTTIGEYEDVAVDLPAVPFSPAYAIASVGYPHRVGLSQYGAYGRAKAGQKCEEIILSYFNAEVTSNYLVPDEIYVSGYGWMPFEGQYLKGIAEMPTYWAQTGGFEALKAQAILARSYALAYTQGGVGHICADQNCQVYYAPKVSDPAGAEWHRAVQETAGMVLIYDGQPVKAFYASTAGGYTRLPSDFDVWGNNGSNLSYLKRVVDKAGDGKAYDGPDYGASPWYYKVWYTSSDIHPWLSQEEMIDLLNSALLPESDNQHLSHPDLGGWSYETVRTELVSLGTAPIDSIVQLTVINSPEGYTSSIRVQTVDGMREVNGWRFNNVFKLRSRGHLALWSSLYDIVVR